MIHAFVRTRAFGSAVPGLEEALARDGSLWISWPKQKAEVPTDLTADVVRVVALAHGLST